MQSPTSRSSSRGSYPSRRAKLGPAPLASFEDLPTDEQQSSSSDEERRNSVITRQPNITFVITDHDEENVVNTIPAEKVTLLCQDTVKEDNFSNHICSNNVGKRKNSWADFFFLRKSPTPSKSKERKFSLFNFNFFSKDSKKIENEGFNENFEMKVSVQSEILESVENHQEPNEMVQESSSYNETENSLSECLSATPTSSVAETVIVQIEHESNGRNEETESKTITDTDSRSTSSLSVCSRENCPGVAESSCCETDCQECAQQYSCDCSQDTDCCIAADNEDNDEESATSHSKFYDSYELDLLLKGDELELNNRFCEEDIENSLPKVVKNVQKESLKCNLKLSLEKLKTSPIERPRSITPININIESFEAYVNQPMPCSSNGQTCDKLTITLPGVSNNAKRNRFARKSNPFIWQEFCEKGLRSPLVLRKRANSCFPQISQNYFFNEAFEVNGDSGGDLTPITPLNDLNSLEERLQVPNGSPWASGGLCTTAAETWTEKCGSTRRNEYTRTNQTSEINCSCDCNCSTSFTNTVSLTTCSEITSEVTSDENDSNSFEATSQTEPTNSGNHEDQPLVSPCDCTCHHVSSVLSQLILMNQLSEVEAQSVSQTATTGNWDESGWQRSPTLSTLSSSTTVSSSSSSSSQTSVSPVTQSGSTTTTSSTSSWTTSQSARLLDSSTASNL